RAEAAKADAARELGPAQRTRLDFLEVQSGILFELLVDDLLQLHGRELQDVVRRYLLRCDFELLLRKEANVQGSATLMQAACQLSYRSFLRPRRWLSAHFRSSCHAG